MTWVMFGEKILHPESGAYFRVDDWEMGIQYFPSTSQQMSERFRSEKETEQRFEELTKMLVTDPQHAAESRHWETRIKRKLHLLLDNVDEYLLKELQTKLNED